MLNFKTYKLDLSSILTIQTVGLALGSALILGGLLAEMPLFILLPFAALFLWVIALDIRIPFYLLFAIIPFSIEYYLPNGLGTDLPSEPLMWLITALTVVLAIHKKITISALKRWHHPITYLILLHLFWIVVTIVTSTDIMRSAKYLIAKIWYIVPFYVYAIYVIRDQRHLLLLLKIIHLVMVIIMTYAMIRHIDQGLSFDSINKVVQPFYRNHVNYACIIVLTLPYTVYLLAKSKSQHRKWYIASIVLSLACIYFSYTRAAILCVFIGIGAYYIIKRRWIKPVLICLSCITLAGATYLSVNNNFLKLAPDYEKTITHKKFGNLIEATYKMEDISTMERVYRWVAGFEMVSRKPIFGFGPNNFFINYSQFTITAFQTYVSDNPDNSGVHNYFLMLAVDQGVMGLVIFLVLVFGVLVIGENYYHNDLNHDRKKIIMMALVSFVIILSLNLINDLIETDKIGPYFFLNMAIIVLVGSNKSLMVSEK